jgi:NADPH:quinone reductase-like Zn-dependent oxidoreductase
MKAVIVNEEQRLVLAELDEPIPELSEAFVRVSSVSINRGEIGRAPGAVLDRSSGNCKRLPMTTIIPI